MLLTHRKFPLFPLSALIAAIVLGSTAYLFWLPNTAQLKTENPKTTAYMQIYIRRELAKKRRPLIMTRWVAYDDISPHLRHAVILAEDDMFYRHHGVDWEALREAMFYNWKKGKMARGASTITQQVARNLFLSPARNPLRKMKEMLIAWKLERTLSKTRILEIYLNIAEWGVGIYGVQAASQIYFGKDAGAVSAEEAVALAAALPSPWKLNPSKPERPGLARRKSLLIARMRRAGYLPPDMPAEEVEVIAVSGLTNDTN